MASVGLRGEEKSGVETGGGEESLGCGFVVVVGIGIGIGIGGNGIFLFVGLYCSNFVFFLRLLFFWVLTRENHGGG